MTEHRSALVATLRAEHQAVGEFCRVLEAERDCLTRKDAEALLQITELKSTQVDRLAELSGARAAHLASLQLSRGRKGMAEWLAGYRGREGAELSRLWRETIALAAKARELNQSNGTMIAARLTHNRAALAALQSAARAHNLYGPDGQPSVAAGNRELGRA
jgi:flagellar biosynthesis protein FlgN